MSIIEKYIKSTKKIDPKMISYVSNLENIKEVDPKVASLIVKELISQRSSLKLIASENYCSINTQCAMANLLTDKYSEGFAYHRFYAGCENVDEIENDCCEKAKKLFNAEHAFVQPHSGSDANLCAYWAILHKNGIELELDGKSIGDLNREDFNKLRSKIANKKLLALDYYSGGHLTHGYRQNISSQMFDVYSYKVKKETNLVDYDEIEEMVKEIKPFILLAGFSAYVGKLDFERLGNIAHKYNCTFMVDMAHFAGLVAGKVYKGKYNPVPYADVVTTTTHKTLRGPRGGMVLCKKEFSESVDKACPLVMGGPLPHVIAAKSISFSQALEPEFETYALQIVKNAKKLAQSLVELGCDVVTKTTENHIVLVNVSNFSLTGRQAESSLRECGVTLNRNALAYDEFGPWYTSGLRLGTPALTTLGFKEKDMEEIAKIIVDVLKNTKATIIEKGSKKGQKSLAK